jgi:hypothetical protein
MVSARPRPPPDRWVLAIVAAVLLAIGAAMLLAPLSDGVGGG